VTTGGDDGASFGRLFGYLRCRSVDGANKELFNQLQADRLETRGLSSFRARTIQSQYDPDDFPAGSSEVADVAQNNHAGHPGIGCQNVIGLMARNLSLGRHSLKRN